MLLSQLLIANTLELYMNSSHMSTVKFGIILVEKWNAHELSKVFLNNFQFEKAKGNLRYLQLRPNIKHSKFL